MKIGTNTQLQIIHSLKQQHADAMLKKATFLISEFVKDIDTELFKKSFVGYLTAEIEKDAVMKLIGKEKVFTHWNELQLLEATYKAYNVNMQSNPKNVYEYHTQNDIQVKAYEYSIKLCELLNSHPTINECRIDIPLLKKDETYSPDCEAILMLK